MPLPVWMPLILAALGSAGQQKQIKGASGRRRAEVRRGREKEKGVEDIQRREVLSAAEEFDPARRQEALDVSAVETEGRLKDLLSVDEISTPGDVGVISDKLLAQRAKSTRDRANTASVLAALTSKVQAPGKVATAEGQDFLDLIAESQGRSKELGRIGRTTKTLAGLEGQMDPKAVMLSGLMQQLGLSAASGSILSGLVPPGVSPGVAAGKTLGATAGMGAVPMLNPSAYAGMGAVPMLNPSAYAGAGASII